MRDVIEDLFSAIMEYCLSILQWYSYDPKGKIAQTSMLKYAIFFFFPHDLFHVLCVFTTL